VNPGQDNVNSHLANDMAIVGESAAPVIRQVTN
jgi:hypothetical protein